MTEEENLAAALADVRRAYRLVYAYQRRLFDLLQHVHQAVGRQGLAFTGWGSAEYGFPSNRQKATAVYQDCWAWDLLPGYLPRFSYASTGTTVVRLDLEVWADTGFEKPGGEPDPGAFKPVEEVRSELRCDVWKGGPGLERSAVYARLLAVHGASTLGDGRRYVLEVDGREVSYASLRVDLAQLVNAARVEERLIGPLLALLS